MVSEIIPYEGRQITLQSSNETDLQELRDMAVHGGIAMLTAGLSATVRAISVAVDKLVNGYYRVRVMIEHGQSEFEVARILGTYDLFQRARDAVDRSGLDADLQVRAKADLDRALERRRKW